MLPALLTGAVVAISFAVPPGPVLVETIRRGLRGGFRPALLVQLGSIIGDLAWCAVALFGLGQFASQPWVRVVLGSAGVLVLLWLGAKSINEALRPLPQPAAPGPAAPPAENQRAFNSGMALSLTNPWAIGYWMSVGGALVGAGVTGATAAQTAAFVGGYTAGVIFYGFVVAACFRWLQRHLSAGSLLARLVTGLCGLALVGLGLGLGWQVFVPRGA